MWNATVGAVNALTGGRIRQNTQLKGGEMEGAVGHTMKWVDAVLGKKVVMVGGGDYEIYLELDDGTFVTFRPQKAAPDDVWLKVQVTKHDD